MVARIARIIVAAPSSGAGKTTVAVGLMAALRKAGHVVAPFKVGPDYIDPGYHAVATGRPGRNLDVVLCGEHLVQPLFGHGSAGADVAVVEGVMGLFDGKGGTPYGSTAHVATLLAAPVLLVVDAQAMSASVAALVHGFSTFDPGVRPAGVVLNRVGSDRHEAMLRAALSGLDVPVVGAIHRSSALGTPSRHLGLVPATERPAAARATVDAAAEVVARSVDLAAVVRLATGAPPLAGQPWHPSVVARIPRPNRVGVVTGPAFGFVYREHLELLAAAGAEVVPVSQDDEALPARIGTLYVPGGFPEVCAAELAANVPLRSAVRRFAAAGGTVFAECGGLLWLAEELDGQPMCGVLPARARMTDRLTLGYRLATVAGERSLAGGSGDEVPAHEFHYSTVEPAAGPVPAWRVGDRSEGFATGNVHASYLHTHWAGAPAIARNVARGSGVAA